MIANTLPELRGFRSGICDDVAVGLLKRNSVCQPYVSNDIDSLSGLSRLSGLSGLFGLSHLASVFGFFGLSRLFG